MNRRRVSAEIVDQQGHIQELPDEVFNDTSEEAKQLFEPEDKDKIVIQVWDSGVGIKNADRMRLFKMFSCLQNTSQMNTHGIGQGLFTCKNIVKAFGGSIIVQSELGRGTRFLFSFFLEAEA